MSWEKSVTEVSTDRLPLVVLLMGPTAAGKTELAVELARRVPCDVISVDSALVYRGLDIGTAKPSLELRAEIPHQLIDILDPSERYSAGSFYADASLAIENSLACGHIPLLVGGTMLYFRALQQGMAQLPQANSEVRQALLTEASSRGWMMLHEELAQYDPISAARIHPNDPQRIQRAHEVLRLTGRPLSEFINNIKVKNLPYRWLKLVCSPRERSILYQRIEQRFYAMLKQGFIDEVASLRAREDLTSDLPAMRCVGYRQILEYLCGESSYQEMVQRGLAASRQLAKRQLTWLRSESNCHWLFEEKDQLQQVLDLDELKFSRFNWE